LSIVVAGGQYSASVGNSSTISGPMFSIVIEAQRS
jgi:hypothetical protein